MNARALVAEGLGTLLLLAAVVGSGIMGETLSDGSVGLALLANSIATGLALAVLIFAFGPLSGAHFNPAVTLAFCLRGDTPWRTAPAYVTVQLVGAVLGVVLAHAMFGYELVQTSATERGAPHLWVSEVVATFGLVLFIFAGVRYHVAAVPWLVGGYIAAAYWFTASTSFANPAVTVARALTETFAGIAPQHVVAFIGMQLLGAVLAWALCHWLYAEADLSATPTNA